MCFWCTLEFSSDSFAVYFVCSSLAQQQISSHLGGSSLRWDPFDDRSVLHRAPHPAVGVERVEGGDVGDDHQEDWKYFMYGQWRGGVGQTGVVGGKVPHTSQQGAHCAAEEHQGLRKEEENTRTCINSANHRDVLFSQKGLSNIQ